MRGEFWRDQAIREVMPPWLEHAPDRVNGGFYMDLSRDWKHSGTSDQYPTILGRHLFSLSAAYLMSGDEQYLALARQTAAYLIAHGWDQEFGGWYRSFAQTGEPKDTTKDAFTQMYANTGLALYFFATRDAQARQVVEQSNEIFQTWALDPEYGGYYVTLNRDLSVASTDKSFNPQIGILSSFMLYFYLADGRPAYLEQMRRDMAVARRYMQAPQDGYILDDFDRQWHYRPRSRDGVEYISIGGNVETAWVLMRLYLLTGDEEYRAKALELARKMIEVGWDAANGGWYPSCARQQPDQHDPQKVWFVQAYGNFMLLNLYNLTREPRYLELFRRNADFWNQHFLDREFGGDYISTDEKGNLLDGTKGTSSKCSYHTMEHDLLNYLYLGLYVNAAPVELHFDITAKDPVDRLLVCPVEDPAVHLAAVSVDGKPWTDYDAAKRWVRLPAGEDMRVQVVLRRMP